MEFPRIGGASVERVRRQLHTFARPRPAERCAVCGRKVTAPGDRIRVRGVPFHKRCTGFKPRVPATQRQVS